MDNNMEHQMNMQENSEHMQRNNNSKNMTNIAVRKLLASSALATAIISWIATAQGLHSYVFGHYWQAAIISAAIQGTLFAFSIKAIELLKKYRVVGRIILIFMWFCILISSSIFSYVYISKTVYSNKLLQKDSNRIMTTQYLEIYSLLDDIIDVKIKDLENAMIEYITLLSNDDGKIEINKDDSDDIEKIEGSIKGNVSENIITLLEKIRSGKYSENDVTMLKSLLDSEINKQNRQIEDIQNQVDWIDVEIGKIRENLKTFNNTNSPMYQNYLDEITSYRNEKNNLEDDKEKLHNLINDLKSCIIKIDYIEGGLEKKLYDETLELRKYLNQDTIETTALMVTVEKIYNDLFEFNVSTNDNRLLKYKEFKNSVEQYSVLVDKKISIEQEREKIYTILISQNIEMSEVIQEETNEESDIVRSESGNMENDKKEHTNLDYNWEGAFSSLQNILKDIPQTYFEEYVLKYSDKNMKYLSKNEILEASMNMDRLYLSDLNDFERAWTLLKSDIHIYKTLLKFSLIFSFGIDLFSFGTGLLLYFLDDKKESVL